MDLARTDPADRYPITFYASEFLVMPSDNRSQPPSFS
jgi:hypothetical protein